MVDKLEKKKVPLTFAAESLASLCEAIDNDIVDLTPKLAEHFGEKKLDLAESIDRRIAFINILGREGTHEKPGNGAIGAAQEAYRMWKTRFEQLKHILNSVKNSTMEVMGQFPDLPYQGSLGKLAIQKNAPSLKIDILEAEASFSHVISEADIQFLGIEDRFIKTAKVHMVDTVAVKEAIKNGETLSWCHLEQGKHLRVRT